jgi:hypothetical protein
VSVFFVFHTYSKELPGWITETDKYCGDEFLCAIGEGSGLMMAEAAARSNLSKIFKTKVQGQENYSTLMQGQANGDDPGSAGTDEFAQKQIKLESEIELEGAYVKEKHIDDKGAYVLAVLPKTKAAKLLKERMGEIDELISALHKQGSRSALYRALSNFTLRDELNQKYQIINGTLFAAPITKKKLMDEIDQKRKLGKTIFLKFESPTELGQVKKNLTKQLIDMGYKIVGQDKQSFDYKLNVGLQRNKEFLNVKGFEKYKYIINLEAKNKAGEKIGSVVIEEDQVARSQEQADKQIYAVFKKVIPQKLEEIQID